LLLAATDFVEVWHRSSCSLACGAGSQLCSTTDPGVAVGGGFSLHSGFPLLSVGPFQSTFCDVKDGSDLSFPLISFPDTEKQTSVLQIGFDYKHQGAIPGRREICV